MSHCLPFRSSLGRFLVRALVIIQQVASTVIFEMQLCLVNVQIDIESLLVIAQFYHSFMCDACTCLTLGSILHTCSDSIVWPMQFEENMFPCMQLHECIRASSFCRSCTICHFSPIGTRIYHLQSIRRQQTGVRGSSLQSVEGAPRGEMILKRSFKSSMHDNVPPLVPERRIGLSLV